MLEDTKRLIGRKTHNTMVKEKKVKMINNDLQNTTQKTKIQHQVPHWIPRILRCPTEYLEYSGAPKRQSVPKWQ